MTHTVRGEKSIELLDEEEEEIKKKLWTELAGGPRHL